MSADDPRAGGSLPAAGLASELIPLLRKKLRGDDAPDSPPVAPPPGPAAPAANVLDFADRLAERPEERQAAAETIQLVAFALGAEEYALSIHQVVEILRVGTITRVPHAPPHVRGVTNVRGRLLPVIELRSRLGLEATALDREARIVTVDSRGRRVGLLVDRVSSVGHLPLAAIDPPPEDVLGSKTAFVTGVARDGERVLILLDVERLLMTEP